MSTFINFKTLTMKSILYVGATLMLGASIYGVVDYRNSSQKQEFTGMYEAREEQPDLVVEKKKHPDKPEVEVATTKTERKKVSRKKEFVPAENQAKELVLPVEPIELTLDAKIKNDELKENSYVKKIKSAKPKKINHKLFSRGSLEERYVEKTLKMEPGKKEETKKTEVKEEL